MKNEGTNTATTESMASSRGTTTPRSRPAHLRRQDATREVRVDVFDGDSGFVDQNADSQREAAERHDIDGLARAP